MTERASITKIPPANASRTSRRSKTAETPITAAQCERSGIAHKNLCRIAIEPQKPKTSPCQEQTDRRRSPRFLRCREYSDSARVRYGSIKRQIDPKTSDAIKIQPAASPSRPSVRLTAFDDPVMTNTMRQKRDQLEPSIEMRCGIFEKGQIESLHIFFRRKRRELSVAHPVFCTCSFADGRLKNLFARDEIGDRRTEQIDGDERRE